MEHFISIITVCYNSEKTIARTIESVINQNYHNFEYILVDGKSNDNTLEIIKSYKKKFDERGISFSYISENDNGIYDAMNKGIKLAKGELIGLINSDDYYDINALNIVNSVYLDSSFDVFYSNIALVGKNNRIKIKKAKNKKYMSSRYWNHPTTFIKASIYKTHPFICHGLYDDYELILRLKKEKKHFVICNKTLAYFSFEGITHSNKNFKKSMKMIKERLYIYRRNGYSRFYIFECVFIELLKYFFKME